MNVRTLVKFECIPCASNPHACPVSEPVSDMNAALKETEPLRSWNPDLWNSSNMSPLTSRQTARLASPGHGQVPHNRRLLVLFMVLHSKCFPNAAACPNILALSNLSILSTLTNKLCIQSTLIVATALTRKIVYSTSILICSFKNYYRTTCAIPFCYHSYKYTVLQPETWTFLNARSQIGLCNAESRL